MTRPTTLETLSITFSKPNSNNHSHSYSKNSLTCPLRGRAIFIGPIISRRDSLPRSKYIDLDSDIETADYSYMIVFVARSNANHQIRAIVYISCLVHDEH